MNTLQSDVQGYFESADFNILESREGFILADQLQFGGYHDTRLIWVAPSLTQVEDEDFEGVQQRLIREFKTETPKYPDARYFLIVHTLEGLSTQFKSEARGLSIDIRVPVHFFDTPFKYDEHPEETKSIIRSLVSPEIHRHRVPQPYSVLPEVDPINAGEDLLPYIFKELSRPLTPRLRIIVGPAGIGKSILFRALFSRFYEEFQKHKGKHLHFPRPIPFTPEYLLGRKATTFRTSFLYDALLDVEFATRIGSSTFEWLLTKGYHIWLFDGLDELYANDKEFFDRMLDLLTRKESKAQILIFVRESLLTSCETLAEFLNEFPPGQEDALRVYRLDHWRTTSKRAFACLRLEGKLPSSGQADLPEVSRFLTFLRRTRALESLSGVPFYCSLLMDRFIEGRTMEFNDDIALIENAISTMIEREKPKVAFLSQNLQDWLEELAIESYTTGFGGLEKKVIEEYASLLIPSKLPKDEHSSVITVLLQLPFFAPGVKPGELTFQHELVVEYLAGRYLLHLIENNPKRVANSLGLRTDLSHSLIARYIARHLPSLSGGIQTFSNVLKEEAFTEKEFPNLLALLLLATPSRDAIKSYGTTLESQDLSYLEFAKRDLKGLSFRNCKLTNTVFRGCDLQNAKFEGAHFVETKFEELSAEALRDAQFGNLENFQFIYVDKRKIDDLDKVKDWIKEVTGMEPPVQQPCPTSLQLRFLFLKYVYPNGTGRRDWLAESALTRGKQIKGSPPLEDYITTCVRFGYLEPPDWRKIVKRTSGNRYDDIVDFVKDWKLTDKMKLLLDSLCQIRGCRHVP